MYLGDAHLICGQCACLVRANHVCAPERFDTRQISDDGILLRHLLSAERQASGDDSSKAFGNSRHGQRDSNLEVVDCTFQYTMMGRIPKVMEIDEPNQNTYCGYHFGQHVTKIVELTLQRRFFAYLLGYRVMNVTNGSLFACERDDSACGSIYDGGSLTKGEGVADKQKYKRTENSMLNMSCLTALRSGTTSIDLVTLILSPVRIAWSTRKLLDEIERSLQSAGTLSPTATDIMSPGTSSEAWMRAIWPERNTFASSGEYSLRACGGEGERECGGGGANSRRLPFLHLFPGRRRRLRWR